MTLHPPPGAGLPTKVEAGPNTSSIFDTTEVINEHFLHRHVVPEASTMGARVCRNKVCVTIGH